jgi:hypothetical protein
MFGKSNTSPFCDIGRTRESADFLASQLERLMALPLTTSAEVEAWYGKCDAVQMDLQKQFPQFEPFHEVWHFFADADIRSRDTGYRDNQHRLMSDYVQHLRNEKRDG